VTGGVPLINVHLVLILKMREAQISLHLCLFFWRTQGEFFLLIVYSFLLSGAFAKLRKATISFVICSSISLFVLMEKLGFKGKDFHEN
jgi:hypothetical protein